MKTRLLALACLPALALSSGAMAQFANEVGDAGQMPGTAQAVTGAGMLLQISGTISGTNDADMYLIHIDNPALFSASTNIMPGTMTDTTLYLFSLDGVGIAKNDDVSGSNFLSELPIGNPAYAGLAPGNYLLAVAGFSYAPYWNEPPVYYSDLVFDLDIYTGVVGPQAGAGPIAGWYNNGAYDDGSYNIVLTGASHVPAPGPVALLGASGLIALRRRRN